MPSRGNLLDGYGVRIWSVLDISLLATGQTLVVPPIAGARFVPVGAPIYEISDVNAPAGAPVIRLGNNGSFNNLVTLSTVLTTSALNELITLALIANVKSLDIGTTGISVDVQTAGTGTSWKINVYVPGLLV